MPHLIDLASLAATEEFGLRLGERLFPGSVITLIGTLGAGKTHLVRAVVEGLGGSGRQVTSPTFGLIHEYKARLPVYHFDAYRLKNQAEFADLGVHEYFEGHGVCLVEWADRVPECVPPERLQIELEITGETSRRVILAGFGQKYDELIKGIT